MSTMSRFEADHSEELARRFAHLAAAYFDHPSDAKVPAARIPLENLFRMLQMFRYDAFSDEPRSGILEMRGFDEQMPWPVSDEQWHSRIEAALRTALNDAFGNNANKDEAVDAVQAALRWLATNANAPSPDVLQRTKRFLERFSAALT